ncbi:MAG: quaternary ammonium compound efflux SMR transporter SugE [Deltaproteobacteria bacterium]|nr:quaternary ammonium compound efflux SMR transporter SugE [Deltaproteobacteria bacterium]
MACVYLFVAGLMEVGWAVGLKYTDGFSRLWPTIWTVATMVLSLFFLGQALRSLPLGTAYAVWTGIGAVGAAVLGIILFGDSKSVLRFVSIGLIMAGIAGLRISA